VKHTPQFSVCNVNCMRLCCVFDFIWWRMMRHYRIHLKWRQIVVLDSAACVYSSLCANFPLSLTYITI
jgi:hypothetical protein